MSTISVLVSKSVIAIETAISFSCKDDDYFRTWHSIASFNPKATQRRPKGYSKTTLAKRAGVMHMRCTIISAETARQENNHSSQANATSCIIDNGQTTARIFTGDLVRQQSYTVPQRKFRRRDKKFLPA